MSPSCSIFARVPQMFALLRIAGYYPHHFCEERRGIDGTRHVLTEMPGAWRRLRRRLIQSIACSPSTDTFDQLRFGWPVESRCPSLLHLPSCEGLDYAGLQGLLRAFFPPAS